MVKFMGPTLKFLVGAVICRKSEARHFKFGLENVENDFFGFPTVKWLHMTGEVDRSLRCSCQIFVRI